MPLITYSDFIEMNEKLKAQKPTFFLQKLNPISKNRTMAHWNSGKLAPVNWWNIPMARERWNYQISGDTSIDFAKYSCNEYISKLKNPKILSIGCGTGSQELLIAKIKPDSTIIGIDIASKNIEYAIKRALEEDCLNTKYITADFDTFHSPEKFDFIIFHSSLHHMSNIERSLVKAKEFMHSNSKLIILEYTGPNRINWTKEQLNLVNELLPLIPESHRKFYFSKNVKTKQSAPGYLRMCISDPSEAPQSALILEKIRHHFNTVELKGLGGNILAPLLKGISHHFIAPSLINQSILTSLFKYEDNFLADKKHDHYFGVFSLA